MFGRNKTKIEAVFLKSLGEKNLEEYAKINIKEKTDKPKPKNRISKMFEEIGKKKVSTTDETISFENKTFPLPQGIFTYKEKNKIIIFYDYENEKILCFREHSCLVNCEWLDQLLTKKLISQLVNTIRKGMQEVAGGKTLLQFIFVGGVCLAIGALLGKGYL